MQTHGHPTDKCGSNIKAHIAPEYFGVKSRSLYCKFMPNVYFHFKRNKIMMKNFPVKEIFLKKLAICSQFRPHEGMRKKCFLLACFLCTGALAVPTVFGKEPTNAELFNIAKEAYEKGLWKPDLNAYTFGKQETYAVDGLQDIKGNDDLLAAFEKTYACWVRLTKEAYRLYGFDIRMGVLSVWFEDLEKILLQEDDSEWNKVKPLLKGLAKAVWYVT